MKTRNFFTGKEEENIFPPPSASLGEQGVLAVSRGVTPEMLLTAYSNGIFPWPEGEGEVYWCSPPERGVLFLENFHIGKSLLRAVRNQYDFSFYVNRDFPSVIQNCALAQRKDQEGTWITRDLIPSYIKLHEMGIAHSFEAYNEEGELAGGLYGISCGKIFCGESMFFKESGASKFAFICAAKLFEELGGVLFDTQMVTPMTGSFGAELIPRKEYFALLKKYGGKPLLFGKGEKKYAI